MSRTLNVFASMVSLLLMTAIWTTPALATKRVALVIGNSDYARAGELKNPGNDAKAVAAALTRLGFKVRAGYDLTLRQALEIIDRFADDLESATAAIFYYSGHGIQLGGHNYLLPVDLDAKNERAIRYGTVDVADIVSAMERAAEVSIVVLDACRNNPFANKLKRSLSKTRSARIGRGFARMQLQSSGAIIAYSAAAGEVAADGEGDHSPFTKALLQEIEKPGVEVGLVFRRVAGHVVKATGGKQRPELLVRLTREYYLKLTGKKVAAAGTQRPPTPVQSTTLQKQETAPPAAPAAKAKKPAAIAQVTKAMFRPGSWGYMAAVEPVPLFVAPNPWIAPAARRIKEIEPNKTRGTAQPVGPNDTISMSVHPKGDCDWFSFVIGHPGRLNVIIDDAPAEIDMAVRVRNPENQPVYSGGSEWIIAPRPGGAIETSFDLATPGRYSLQACDSRNDQAVPDTMHLRLAFSAQPDVFEPNNSIGSARAIPLTGDYRINVLPKGDKDLFRLTTFRPGELRLSAREVPEGLDIAIAVNDVNGKPIYTPKGVQWLSPPRKGGDTEGSFDLPRPGVYFIHVVDGRNDAAQIEPFLFATKFTPSPDGFEPNGTIGNAWPVAPSGSHRLAILPKADGDWLRIDVGHPGELKLTATKVPSELDVVFRVLNSDKQPLYTPTGQNWIRPPRAGGDTEGLVDLPRPGTYFIEIRDGRNDARSVEPFELTTLFTPAPDQYEPNNSVGTASTIRAGGEIAFNILPKGDTDWFKITVDQPGALTIEVDESPRDLDLVFRVRNADRKPIYMDGQEWIRPPRKGGLTQAVADLPAPGTYYVQVADGRNDARSVEHAVLRTRFRPTVASREPNNSQATAARVPLVGETWAHILPKGDGDWHLFKVAQPGALKVVVDKVAKDLDVVFRVIDADRKPVYVNNTEWVRPPRKGGVTEGVVEFAKPGWYWMEIRDGRNDGRSPEPFRIVRSFTPAG